jgi:hypothetical protein
MFTTFISGLDITSLVQTQTITGAQVGLWTPTLNIPEASSTDVATLQLSLYPNNYYPNDNLTPQGSIVRLQQHYIVTLTQPNLDFTNYPDDTQNVEFRLFSFEVFNFTSLGGGLVGLATDAQGEPAMTQNPLWTYLNSGGDCGPSLQKDAKFGEFSHAT